MEIGRIHDGGESGSARFDDVGLDDFQHPEATMNAAAPAASVDDDPTEHDQLPNVDEYKASQNSTSHAETSRMKNIIIVCALVSMAFLMLLIGLLVGGSAEGKHELSKGVHTLRAQKVAEFLVHMGWTDSVAVQTFGTPQYRAAYWLAEEDPLQMETAIDREFMQRFVLATFYYSLGGENWSHEVNFMSKDHSCKWNVFYRTHSKIPVDVGASCYGGDSLRQIYLPGLNLNGEIPPEIGLLLDLTDLDLHDNKVYGILPEELKNLQELKNLRFNQNRLIGNLPIWISHLTNLKSLQVSDNDMHGQLPSSLSDLTQLTNLVLERNGFSGPIDTIGGLSAIRSLYLGDNRFSGAFNDTILWTKGQLEILDVSDNQLTGTLPTDLFSMDSLVVADLHGNQFGGRLPPFASIENKLRFLALHDNKLNGHIDHRLEALTHLEHLDLSKNFFTGAIPTNLGHIKTLRYLFLAFNENLDAGPIPIEYTKLPNLVDLSLQRTNRNGTIPYEFTIESDSLVLLDLNTNHLTGTIPPELGSMEKLKFLLLKDNKLTGTVPSEFANLGSLHTLLLEDNSLTGSFDGCSASISKLALITADCMELASCSCCTKCCAGTCTEEQYFSGLDPVATSNYARDGYNFLDEEPQYTTPEGANYTGYEYDPYSPLPP